MSTSKPKGLLSALLIVLLSMASVAVGADGLQRQFDALSGEAGRSRGLALSTLKQLKQLDRQYRSSGGYPLEGRISEARSELGRIKLLRESFTASKEECDKQARLLSVEMNRKSADQGLVAELSPKVEKVETDLDRYRKAIDKYYNKAVRDFGEPVEARPAATLASGDETIAVQGEVTGGIGSGKYKRPNASPAVDASLTDLSLGVDGRWMPAEQTHVLFNFNRDSRVQRRERVLTDLGATCVHQLSSVSTIRGGFQRSAYSDKDNDAADFSDMALFAKYDLEQGGRRFDAKVSRVKRKYSNLTDADYSTTNLHLNAGLPAGPGLVKLRLNYLSRSNDIDSMDFKELSPGVVWYLTPGGSELGLTYQKFTHPGVDDSPLDNNRIKAHFHMVDKDGHRTVRWGPEVLMYKFPNNEDVNYTDFRLIHYKTVRGDKTRSAIWDAMYRRQEDTMKFDFVQVSYRRNSLPVGSGTYSRFNMAARAYVESAGGDDSLLLANYADPHTLDLYFAFGWTKAGFTWFDQLSFGPIVATKAYIDTERDGAFDEDIVDVDFVFRNPANTARAGGELRLAGSTESGVLWRGSVSYIMAWLYNADPMRTTGVLAIDTKVTYPVNDRWLIDVFVKIHNTKADIASAADLEKTDIGVQARYLFDIRR